MFLPNQAIDLNTLSDDDFDTHIDTLTPTEAIEAISQRRGVEDADQYAHWRKAVLNKQRDAAQRKLNAKHKPFDPSRYNSYPEMKRAEALYNQQISQQHDQARATIDALDKQIADINQYQNRRNAQIAAEREAYNDYDTPATSTTPRITQQEATQPTIQPSSQPSDTTPIPQHSQDTATDRPTTTTPTDTGTTRQDVVRQEYDKVSEELFKFTHDYLTNKLGYNFQSEEDFYYWATKKSEKQLAKWLQEKAGLDTKQTLEVIQLLRKYSELRKQLLSNPNTTHQDIVNNRQDVVEPHQSGEITEMVQPVGQNILGNLFNQFRGKAQEAINFLLNRGEGNAIAALNHPQVGDIDLWYGNDKAGLKKIAQKHPEVLDDLQGIINNMHVVKASDNRIVLESDTHRAIVSKMLGNEKTDNWLLSAYELKSTSAGSSDIDTEPIGMQNGTAALHSTPSDNKDSERRENNKISSLNFSSEPNPILSKDTTNPQTSNNSPSQNAPDINEASKNDDLRTHIASWQQTINAPIVVLSNIHEVNNPQARAAIASATLSAQRFPGWFSDGTIYLYLPHCTDTTDIDRTILHECIAHYGVRKLFPSPHSLNRFYDQVWNMMQHNDRQRFLQYPGISNLTGNKARRAAADEYIAHLAEQLHTQGTTITPEQTSIWQRIVSFLRNALRQAGINIRITDADINNTLISAYQQLKSTNLNPQTGKQPFTITPTQYTTKRGKVLDMHLVKFNNELTKEQYNTAKQLAKTDKGWYDREKGGFMMRSQESAKQLADTIIYNDDISDAQHVSMTDIQSLNNGDTVFTEPQQTEDKPNTPIWQYAIHVDTDGYTTLRRDDISGEIPIADDWGYSADSPEEMLDILRNPHNNMQEVLDAVGVTLENKIKSRELDRKIAEQRKQEYEALRANGVNGYKIGEKVIYKGKEATIHDFEQFGAHQPVLDTGMAPVIYEVAEWSKIKKPQHNQSASSQTGQDLTTGYSTDNDAETSAKIVISNQGAKHELNKLIHKYSGVRKTRGFISDLANALSNRNDKPKQTYYFEFKDKAGNPYTLRISNHNVNGENIADNEKEISIVIKSRRHPNNFVSGNADVIEYVYFKESIANGDGQTLAWIVQDIATMLDTGVYADNSGMAVINTTPQSETPTIQTPTNQGQFNLVSDQRMAELKERLRRKLGGQMNIGIDPEILSIGLEIAVGHIDRGIKSFTDFARVMIADLGDTIRPYLKAFYNGARELPEVIETGLANNMTPYDEVQKFDVTNFDRTVADPIATAQTVARETEVTQEVETAKQRIKRTGEKKKSLHLQGNQLNLFDNDTRTEQNTRTDNSRTQPRREELPDTQSVEPGTPLQHTVETGRSERGDSRISSSQSGDRPLYDVNKNYTNDEIKEIVSSVTDIVDGKVVITSQVTDDIKAIARQYRSGGVAKKGRGILDEYYTDGKIVDAVNLIIAPYFKGVQPVRVLEPSIGIGNFISAVDNIPTSQIVAFEINDTTARIAKILYPQVDVNLRSFETEFIDETGNKKPLPQKFNLIIGNPPYGSHRGIYKGLGEESKIARYEDYFVKRSLDVLNDGGILAMVLPSSWIDRHTRYGGYTIEAAYRLPSGAFEATEVGTDIVVLRKDNSVPVSDHTPYFEQHPDKILGDIKQRKGRYGRIEKYVEGNIDTAIEAINRNHAEQLANRLDIAPSNDNLNNIEDAIDETGSTDKATDIVQTAKAEANNTAPSNNTGKKSKYKTELNRGVETVPTSQQFSHAFSEGEVEAFADTDYDGTINNHTKHRKYANYMGGRFVHDFYYAEGNIYDKLYQLEQEKDHIIKNYGQEQFDKQKRLLENVLPKRKGLSEITISPNTAFVKNLYIDTNNGRTTLREAFIDFCRKLPYNAFGDSSSWEVIGYVNNEQVYGQDKQRNALVRERRKRVANDLFIKFLNEELSPSAQNQVVAAFNHEYNSTYRPDYSRVPMFSTINKDFKGKPLKLTSVQLAGIGRMTVKGVGLLAHEVGFGKTLSGILAMHEAMTRGFATKPLIVVPNNNILEQWVETIKEVLPQATVNTLGNLGTSYDLTDFNINDGEFTIVTYEGLKAMSFSDDTYNRLAERFSYITEDLNKHQSERDIQKEIEKKNELKGKMRRGTKTSYMFEDFGFDWLTIDEVHNANHIVSKVRLDKSVASDFRSQSQRTSELGLKTWLAAQYIQEENNGRNVLLLSATPFTNKPLEYYSILSLIANDMLRRKGFFNVDQFFETFMEADNELEIAANGKPTQKTNIRRFRNNGLFQQLLSEFIDIKGEEDNPDLVRPNRINKEYKIAQNEITADAIAAVQDLLNDNDTVLQGIGHARAAAFSPYATSLLGVTPRNYREFVNNSPKIDATIKMIEQNKKDRPDAGQIIYSEVGVEFFPMIRDYLVNVSGFKPSEVRIITGATSNNERINIQSAFNKGEVKVVIGSPAIKEGLNLQENTTDMYILSLPWNFTQLRQIEGRGWRQGNKWENIRINYMLTNDSVDVFMLQRLQLKQGLYNEAMKSGAETLDVSDIDTSELKTALITDPDTRAEIVTIQERAKLERQKTQIEADLSFVLRKFEAYNKLLNKLEEKKKEINLFKEWAAGGNTYWADRITSEENKLNSINNEIQEEKERLQKKGVNVDDITRQTEQAQSAIKQIEDKIENLKDFKEQLSEKYRKERQEKEDMQGDLLATYIDERKAENNSGFYKIRPTRFRSVDNYTVTEDIKRIVGISSQVNHSHYVKGTTDNGETWQLRISNHPAAFINIEDHLQEDEQMPDYFTSIVITDNPDVITRGRETLEQQRRRFNNSPDFENIELDQLIIDTRTLNSDNYQDFLDEFQEHFDLFRHTGRSYFNDDYGTRFRSITPSMADFRAIRPNESITDYAEQIILRTANYNNKLPGSHLRFRMTHRTEATVSGWINQRTDLNPTQRQAIIRYIDTLDSTAMQLATARWFTLGTIRIPDDITRVRQAMQVAHKAKVDPLTYDYPMAILNQFPNLNPDTQPINPDDLPTLNNKQSLPHGITIYNVDETPQAQQHIRDIIDTHLGTRANPWCITSAINGRLTDEARNFWKAYNAHPKRVAFRDGRIIAFFAADIPIPIWWDTQDRPHSAIPIAPLTEYNEQNNTIDTYNPDGTILNSTPAEQNENENPKTPNAPSSTNNVGTVANKREQSELVQSLPSESNLGDSHIAPLVRDTASQENTHTIADATIAHIEQIGDDYTRYIDNIAEQVEQALTPQSTDDARTLAEKAILRFRFTDDTNTSPLAGRDAPPVREEISMGSVSPEEQSIIDNAKSNGTYLLAPNGRPTNLSPRQWVQVRTRAFKRWFGDWEKQARVNKLRYATDATITGNEIEITDNEKQNKKNALEYGKTLQGEYTNKDTGNTIQLQRGRKNGGINEVLQHNYKDAEHLQSIAAIPQIIVNSIFVEEVPNKDTSKNPDVVAYQHYVCGLKIGNTDYTVHSLVAVDKKGDRYYDHNLIHIEKIKLLDIVQRQAVNEIGFGTTPDTESTTNFDYKYNALLSILQTNSSKIVDENGEPKVVRHNTNNKFNIFNDAYRGSNTGDMGVYGAGFYFGNIGQTDIYGYHEMDVFLNMRNPKILPDDNIMTFFDYILENFDEPALHDIIINDAFNENRKTTLGKLINSIKEIKEADRQGEYNELISQMQAYWGKGAHDLVLERKIFDKAGAGILRQLTNFVVDNISPEKFTNGLKKAGYDGVIKDWYEYVAFSPNQIKSATDNIGTFDNRLNDIRFRSVKDGEFLNRNNLTPEEFSRLTNSIANAMDTNDHNHRMTWFTERHFDSMQRLANLISDIPGTNPDSQYSPWITQNQAKSRAQAAICH